MSPTGQAKLNVTIMRPFLPAKDWCASFEFYKELGFTAFQISDRFASIELGSFAFFLQDYYVKEWADNMMMHLAVPSVDRWWEHINKLNLHERFDVRAPAAPKLEPWGLRVAYVWDPSGVLWHFAQEADCSPLESAQRLFR